MALKVETNQFFFNYLVERKNFYPSLRRNYVLLPIDIASENSTFNIRLSVRMQYT